MNKKLKRKPIYRQNQQKNLIKKYHFKVGLLPNNKDFLMTTTIG